MGNDFGLQSVMQHFILTSDQIHSPDWINIALPDEKVAAPMPTKTTLETEFFSLSDITAIRTPDMENMAMKAGPANTY